MEQGSRTRLMTAVILAVVFGSGALLGLAMDSSVLANPASVEASGEESEERQDERGRRRRPPIYSRVDPTEAQQLQIDSIVRIHRERMRALNDEFEEQFNPQYRSILEDTRDGIAAALTPEQAAEYRRLLEEFDRRREERDK